MKKVLFATLFFYCTFLNAQIVFEKGYFIDQKGTTINCYIRNVDWFETPKDFLYKLSESDTIVKTGTLRTAQEFGIENSSKFKRFTLKIERSQTAISSLTDNRYPDFREETLFLKTLVEGEATLYQYKTNNITKYFFEKLPLHPIEQLISIKYTVKNNTAIQWNNQFRQQLFNDVKCPEMTESTFKNIEYKEKELTRHFKVYNSCGGKTSITYEERVTDRKKFSLSPVFSIATASIKVADPNTAYNVNATISGIQFRVGFEAEYFLRFNKNTWSIVLDPAYAILKSEKKLTKSNGLGGNTAVNYDVTANITALDLPVGIRYHIYGKNGGDLFLNAFAAYQFQSGSTLEYASETNLANADKKLDLNSGFYVALGGGYKYKKVSAALRATLPQDLLSGNYVYWSGKFSTIGIALGYQIL